MKKPPLPIFALLRRGGFCARQRGFTLVELAIALAVVGLVLGATLIPLRALDEIRRVKDEQRRLEVVRDAIVGYALRHRTRARTIRLVTSSLHLIFEDDFSPANRVEREYRLPAGRPYLPCPDWDGDGFEDRLPEGARGFVQGMEVTPGLTVTTIFEGSVSHGLIWNPLPSRGPIPPELLGGHPYGECQMTRGAVPWRTLGIPPADGWGNRHTYFVDPVFSNAMFGFDRQTIADIYDPRIPEAPGLPPSRRHFRSGLRGYFGHLTGVIDCPAAICDGGRSRQGVMLPPNYLARPDACTTHTRRFIEETMTQCGWEDWSNLVLKAGSATKTDIDDGRRHYPPGSVTDGLPFVLVSHGPNGRFAVNHWASLGRPVDSSGFPSPVCNFAWADISRGEHSFLVNGSFSFHSAVATDRALVREAVNGSRLSPSGESCPPVYASDIGNSRPNFSFFVWEPPGPAGPAELVDPLAAHNRSGFDDLLLWMTREELSLAMPGQIPPLPRMVVAYFP